MSTEYGTARYLRSNYDPRARIMSVALIDMKGDWNHTPPERVRIVPADAIVIERAALPPVTVREGWCARAGALDISTKSVSWSESRDGGRSPEARAAMYRTRALDYLAAAEYLDAHPPLPPVSDEDVETLAGLLCDVAPLINGDLALARRLLATGRVSVTR